jgi:hypothetical protein
MERICSRCHALIAEATERCPACGGEVVERPAIAETEPSGPTPEVDHRGMVLPRRHALGGIITPQ